MISSAQTSPSLVGDIEIQYLHHNQPIYNPNFDPEIIEGFKKIPKTLPARYFYDAKGSQLFEQICQLPEYYPTRTEASILQKCANEIAAMTGLCEIVELGSGSSTKTRLLLNAYQTLGDSVHYVPIDVSAEILVESAKQLVTDYPNLKVTGLVGTYDEALEQLIENTPPGRLVIFLGSSIGNFTSQDCDRFLQEVAQGLQPGDYFLLGVDLQKSPDVLEAAYNDSQGVTAAFNLNMLEHLNWRFDGNFNLSLFKHRAIYNSKDHQIEMYLDAQADHKVSLNSLNLTLDFKAGETIHTEISRKFNWQTLPDYLSQQGLKSIGGWVDEKEWFGLMLCQVQKVQF
ncbi:L-histidine N(alpha)-methyltransferase [Spirulina subsalsa FACHB-351]|uniref:L-histidine N(Alpha)-methyltransferase n=1 Tax=Spirulina subsalsa FACHB-351 TaxID=234711 RepID=A0ABT3L1E7_9CYAN|nr:L-histidine N(alpha)-methyltransferase [Spirulina subsalsa]MCW6034855.1 L-histidine N(alpha)-methyltransferase [Spirulina subsalsa FACHB-351]